MTPREFGARLTRLGWHDEHISLIALFERARYGPTVASETERQEAVACLKHITQSYGGSA